MPVREIPKLVQELYEIVKKLEGLFPGRPFTPDGHLVGSIGEVLAYYHYGLELLPPSYEGHDAKTKDGKLVQIKATQKSSVALRSRPEHLIVLKLNLDGTATEIYNGPGEQPWEKSGKLQKNGQKQIPISKLISLQNSLSKSQQLPKIIPFFQDGDLNICILHKQMLLSGVATVNYGLFALPKDYWEIKKNNFPNSNSFTFGGCCIGPDSKKSEKTTFCPVCRGNEKLHDKSNK